MGLKIGELAQVTGTTAPTIRYYEEIGLLPTPSRAGGQHRYGDDDVRRLTFIRRCPEFGFRIAQVRRLATLMQDGERPCSEARGLAPAHLAAVREKLSELRALEHNIAAFIEAADVTCSGGPGVDCVVLEELAEPVKPSPRRKRVDDLGDLSCPAPRDLPARHADQERDDDQGVGGDSECVAADAWAPQPQSRHYKRSSTTLVRVLGARGDDKLPEAPERCAHSTDVGLGHLTSGHVSTFR